MYKSFHIRNFRCFDDLKMNNLARINLIAGRNNVGKTAILEAMFVHGGINNPELALRINAFRGLQRMRVQLAQWAGAPWDALFYGFDTTKEIIFEGKGKHVNRQLHLKVIQDPEELKKIRSTIQSGNGDGSDGVSATLNPIRVLQLESREGNQSVTANAIMDYEGINSNIVPPPPADFVFLAARNRQPPEQEADHFTNLVSAGKKQLLLDTLKPIEHRINNLELLKFGGETMIHGDIGMDKPMPLIYMGDGLNRLVSIVISMAYAKDGVVLVDEIENGLHYSVLKDIWKAIGRAAREFNTQIFATTHSWECIVAAHQAFSESENYDFRYHRLDRNSETGKIGVVSYDQETMDATIEMNLEAR